jgi:hypothetical protein
MSRITQEKKMEKMKEKIVNNKEAKIPRMVNSFRLVGGENK